MDNASEDFEIKASVVHTDIREIGEFLCGDDMINKIHDAIKHATLTNSHGIPTDCPHREKNGWTGDALTTAEQALLNFDMFSEAGTWFYKYLAGICIDRGGILSCYLM